MRVELLRRLEDDEAEARPLRLDAPRRCPRRRRRRWRGRGRSGVLPPRFCRSRARAQDRLHRARARVGGELEQRNARQVADDAHARDAGGAVVVGLGQLLDGAGRPARVQPANVATEHGPPRPRRRAASLLRYAGNCGSVSGRVAFRDHARADGRSRPARRPGGDREVRRPGERAADSDGGPRRSRSSATCKSSRAPARQSAQAKAARDRPGDRRRARQPSGDCAGRAGLGRGSSICISPIAGSPSTSQMRWRSVRSARARRW